jgi:hypothetical protein
MYSAIAACVDRLDAQQVIPTSVLKWGCPVPFFGELASARVATVGINPSNREFVDTRGLELRGSQRRLPTLTSLGLARWSEVDAGHLRVIIEACSGYFRRNPYDRWFKVLERLLTQARASFYGPTSSACHVDLVPYATTAKWGDLPVSDRRFLLTASADALGELLRRSPLELLILNGQSVVEHFQLLTGVRLDTTVMSAWELPRRTGRAVRGLAYSGVVEEFGGVMLARPIRVAGYNHNVQSSFGITGKLMEHIGEWLRAVVQAPAG